MKKRILSSLLMGALFVASMSTFTSCKDYDDDINNLQAQIDKAALASEVTSLQTTVNGVATTASSALTKAENAASAAATNATAIAAVKTVAENNGSAITAALGKIATAQTSADDAATAAKAAQTTADAGVKAAAEAAASATDAATAAKTAQDAANVANEAIALIKKDIASTQGAASDAAIAAQAAQMTADSALAVSKGNLSKINVLALATKLLVEYTDSALTEAGVAHAAAIAAQASADNAQADATKALEEIGNIQKTYVTSTSLNDQLATLKSEILSDTTSAATLAKLAGKVESYKGSINSLYSAVTSVELFGSYSGDGYTWAKYLTYDEAVDLTMFHGTISKSSLFGNNETYSEAPKIVSFVKGDDIANDAGVILRVNPTDVDLKTANIKLINSKGEELTLVEVGKCEKFTDLITTTRSTINSGLWKVGFKVKDGVTEEAFKKAVQSNGNQILFAVAVNNTAADSTSAAAKDRYVATTWDVAPAYETYAPADYLEYKVNNKNITEIHNRWNGSKTVFEDGTDPVNTVKELTWKEIDGTITPDTAYTDDNTTEDAADARSTKAPLTVQVGTAFTVAIADVDLGNAKYIKSYYVVLDKDRALESAPSEWNAWSKYDITGMNKMVDAEDKLDLTINSQAAQGDIIGFRVFAVNYDGTLVDPDGRAFYVQVGDKTINTESVAASVTATVEGNGLSTAIEGIQSYANTKIVALSKSLVDCDAQAFGMITFKAEDNPSILTGDINVFWSLKADEKGATSVSNWKDAKYIAVSIDKPGLMKDGATLTATINGQKTSKGGYAETVNTINLAVTKVLPTAAPDEITWKSGFVKDGTYTCYLNTETGNWNANSATGLTTLDNIVTGLPAAPATGYAWNISKAVWNSTNNAFTDALTADAGQSTATKEAIPQALIDNSTAHTMALQYTYAKISCKLDKPNGTLTGEQDYTMDALSANIIFACALAPSIQTYAWQTVNGDFGAKDKNGKVVLEDKAIYQITYSAGNAGELVRMTSTSASEAATSAMILGTNSLFAQFTGVFSTSNYVDGTFNASLTSDETGKADFYTLTYDGSTFTFTNIAKQAPTADVPSHLNITCKDAFNHDVTISLPVTIKKGVITPAKRN